MRANPILLLILAAALTVAGCGSGDEPSTSDRPKITEKADLGAPLPDAVQQKGTLAIGVKCDYPPFGYIDEAGDNAGFEIDIAHRLAGYAFGDESKVELTCVTGSNRVPFLTTNRIDLIMATMNYTPERAETIDFTSPYFAGGVKMLVPQDSSIGGWDDLDGKSVITIKGSTASLWLTQCKPDVEQVPFEQTSEALTALTQNRAAAFAQDDTLLVDLAAKNKATKVVGEVKADSPWGMGVRKGDTAMADWVDAAMKKMQDEDQFWAAFQKSVTDKKVQQEFEKVLPRPGNDLSYPTGPIIKC
ncbi:MAG: transporter substrate-binding domain-containing protein [Actinophytocola sp.]|uniref:transporter substrate-binding domain-containing protein n=1 Tax=Actinophytocola sp. TaxID=1872138 RepID=UPI00132311FD|nr:transporter substrate-binding domain-containing protein [Actinophytocola sp.]MPZ84290.1 transporter substrate-binding domain-containing protein [Actinophytocola sp.]